MSIIVDVDGSVRFIHDDDVAELFAAEATTTRRASHVEPSPLGGWFADMSPVGGPVLYASGAINVRTHALVGVAGATSLETASGGLPEPFRTRREALAAEVDWLRRERGL